MTGTLQDSPKDNVYSPEHTWGWTKGGQCPTARCSSHLRLWQVPCVHPCGWGAACMCHRTSALCLSLRGCSPAFF